MGLAKWRIPVAALCALTAPGLLSPITCGALGAPAAKSAPAARGAARPFSAQDFYLHSGDRVVFYGDSITDQRLYTTYIESFCRSRFPRWHLTFVHSGWGGDRVPGGGGGKVDVRIDRDILAYKPTVVTICLGMNDGQYKPLDQTVLADFVHGYEHIVDRLKRELPGVRITLLTAPAFDDVTRAPNFPGGYNGTLAALNDAVRELAQRTGVLVADTNAPLVDELKRAQEAYPTLASSLIPDRVHPSPGGHVVMAAAVLRAWKAPGLVATYTVDLKSGSVKGANTSISGVKAENGGIGFRAQDLALPWPIDRGQVGNHDMDVALHVTSIETDLNRYVLKAAGLTAPRYVLRVDDRVVGSMSRAELEKGVDLADLSFYQPCMQSREALGLIRKHNELHVQRWRAVQVPALNGGGITPEVQQKMDSLDAEERAVLAQIDQIIKPRAYHIQLRPATAN